MSIEPGLIRGVHHVGLPSLKEDWDDIQAFWKSLGMESRTSEVADDSYDHAGAGPRLQIHSGAHDLALSYFCVPRLLMFPLRFLIRFMHVGIELSPTGLDAARHHATFERETHWGHSKTSVFLTGPYGLHVELVTTDPGYHTTLD